MDAQQIKNLIDSKIAGQGTMVDVGGALPTILKAIVDALPSSPKTFRYDVEEIETEITVTGEVPSMGDIVELSDGNVTYISRVVAVSENGEHAYILCGGDDYVSPMLCVIGY